MYLNDILPLFNLRITVYRDKAMVNIRIVNGGLDQKFQFIKAAGPRPSCLHARSVLSFKRKPLHKASKSKGNTAYYIITMMGY